MKPLLRVNHNGECATLIEWARRAGVSPNVLRMRVNHLGAEKAVALSLARPGLWQRPTKRPVTPFVRCRAEGCTRKARANSLCFKHFCAAVRG
jgi:hypothetical protein